MEQHHYFLNTEHRKEDYFSFTDYFMGDSYTFESCADIFSKDNFDYGTTTLLKTVFNNVPLNGTVLDVGCGYGIIGILIKKYYPNLNVKMLDINKNAVMLSCKNANNIGVKVDVFDSNLYDNVKFSVNHIVTNPPIKAGKQNLFNVVIGAKDVLEPNGTITLVIKKKHGMESLKNKMNEIFGNVKILNRDKGYYILHSVKN